MKKFNLLVLLMVFMAGGLMAQSCTPDETLSDTIIIAPLPESDLFPDGGIQEVGCVGEEYETYFYFNIPATIPFNGTDVALTSITVTGITGAPDGFDYVCSPDDCVFDAGTKGCIVLYGTPAAGDVGTHDLKVDVTIIAGGFPIQMSMPDGNIVTGNYYLEIQSEADCVSATSVVNATDFDAKVAPNPLADYSELSFVTNQAGTAELVITDLTGKVVATQTHNVLAGSNTMAIDATTWANGLYMYTVKMNNEQFSGKLVVNK